MLELKFDIPEGLPKGSYKAIITSTSGGISPNPPEVIPVPEPPPPVVVVMTFKKFLEQLTDLFTDPSKWTQPVQVWEFPESAGGTFVPINRSEYLNQDRAGGKFRWFMNGVKRNSYLRDNRGFEIGGYLQDVKYHNGIAYAVVKIDKEIWLAKCTDPTSNKPNFHLFHHVVMPGAIDTTHALEVVSDNRFAIYGRMRASDWNDPNPILNDRRAIPRVIVDMAVTGDKHVYFDPVNEQPGYVTNQFRYDYYATRLCHILGYDIQLISCFQKNDQRVPSTRLDRETGTGPIIPIVAIGRKILSHTKTPIPLDQFSRRTDWPEAHPYEPEPGQLYGVGMTFDPEAGDIDLYFNDRPDTHYLTKEGQTLPNCKVYRISAKLQLA